MWLFLKEARGFTSAACCLDHLIRLQTPLRSNHLSAVQDATALVSTEAASQNHLDTLDHCSLTCCGYGKPAFELLRTPGLSDLQSFLSSFLSFGSSCVFVFPLARYLSLSLLCLCFLCISLSVSVGADVGTPPDIEVPSLPSTGYHAVSHGGSMLSKKHLLVLFWGACRYTWSVS